jgi:hypothetical protein
VRSDDDQHLAVRAQLPEQRKQKGAVQKVHGVTANDDVKYILKSPICNFLKSHSFANLASAGIVAAIEKVSGVGGGRGKAARITLRE